MGCVVHGNQFGTMDTTLDGAVLEGPRQDHAQKDAEAKCMIKHRRVANRNVPILERTVMSDI